MLLNIALLFLAGEELATILSSGREDILESIGFSLEKSSLSFKSSHHLYFTNLQNLLILSFDLPYALAPTAHPAIL
jgi:hypothetical protein